MQPNRLFTLVCACSSFHYTLLHCPILSLHFLVVIFPHNCMECKHDVYIHAFMLHTCVLYLCLRDLITAFAVLFIQSLWCTCRVRFLCKTLYLTSSQIKTLNSTLSKCFKSHKKGGKKKGTRRKENKKKDAHLKPSCACVH